MEQNDLPPYDALLVVSFGGPDGPADVIPFLENVLRGRPVPPGRMHEVAEHYYHFGGRSPLNEQNLALIAALKARLDAEGPNLPVYFGNRNWHPLLPDTVRQMADDGVRRALAFVTSAYASYSGCRQYLENIAAAQAEVGPRAPRVEKLRMFYNHPAFVEATVDRVDAARDQLPADARAAARLIFTAHSIPQAMADYCRYEEQLGETCRLVANEVGMSRWRLVYQSRSGPPSQPWLGPDILDELRRQAGERARDVVVAPIGFLSDHLEVLYDLDTEAQRLSQELGLNMIRAATVGTHPKFIDMIHELIRERVVPGAPRRAIGHFGPDHDCCPADCCLSGRKSGPQGREWIKGAP